MKKRVILLAIIIFLLSACGNIPEELKELSSKSAGIINELTESDTKTRDALRTQCNTVCCPKDDPTDICLPGCATPKTIECYDECVKIKSPSECGAECWEIEKKELELNVANCRKTEESETKSSESGISSPETPYSREVFDRMLKGCNLACYGEETPVSCDNECWWPGYTGCFHTCMAEHFEASYNCDAECWPEHRRILKEKLQSVGENYEMDINFFCTDFTDHVRLC